MSCVWCFVYLVSRKSVIGRLRTLITLHKWGKDALYKRCWHRSLCGHEGFLVGIAVSFHRQQSPRNHLFLAHLSTRNLADPLFILPGACLTLLFIRWWMMKGSLITGPDHSGSNPLEQYLFCHSLHRTPSKQGRNNRFINSGMNYTALQPCFICTIVIVFQGRWGGGAPWAGRCLTSICFLSHSSLIRPWLLCVGHRAQRQGEVQCRGETLSTWASPSLCVTLFRFPLILLRCCDRYWSLGAKYFLNRNLTSGKLLSVLQTVPVLPHGKKKMFGLLFNFYHLRLLSAWTLCVSDRQRC